MKRTLKVGALLGTALVVGLAALVLMRPGGTMWTAAKLGTPIKHSGFLYTLKSAEITDTVDISVGSYYEIATGRPYLLTELRVENKGGSGTVGFPVSFVLVESDGKRTINC